MPHMKSGGYIGRGDQNRVWGLLAISLSMKPSAFFPVVPPFLFIFFGVVACIIPQYLIRQLINISSVWSALIIYGAMILYQ